MMKKIEDLNFYELLEVSPTASAQEIHRAYERVRRVYEPNSIALYSLFTTDETEAIHQRIEEAYRTLVYEDNRRKYDALLRERKEMPELPTPPMPKTYQPRPVQPAPPFPAENRHPVDAEPQPAPPACKPQQEDITTVSQFIGEFTGPAIKALREQLDQSLRTIADQTKVGMRYLEYIEEESYQKLPARAYIRGFLILYAKALGCDPDRMAGDYLKRYDAATGFPYSLRKKPAG
jgi:curved DNA-binding protein CbpA